MDAYAARVLLIEDEPVDAELVRRMLSAAPGPRIHFEHAITLQAGVDHLARSDEDAVLLDLNLPDSRGVDTIRRLREHDANIPIVVFTVADDEETAVEALAAGAQDYLVKDELEVPLLRRSILYALERRRIAQENERLEQRVRLVDRLESLGALCAGMSFGLNTQVGAILDNCHNALACVSNTSAENEVRTALLEIHRAAFRAAEMVQRLRDYAALERSTSGEVELARLTLETSAFLASVVRPEIRVITDQPPEEELYVEIERQELNRLLISLVVNAAEAIGDDKGSISISTGRLEADAELLASTYGWPQPEPGTYAFLRIADTGRGLDTAPIERVFDPFYTTKSTGRGLGLASTLGILHRNRAVVRVEANRPTGTVFTLLFPSRDAHRRARD